MTQSSKSEVRPTTILLDVQLQKTPSEEQGASLQELRHLIETLGWDIVGTLTQKLQFSTAASARLGKDGGTQDRTLRITFERTETIASRHRRPHGRGEDYLLRSAP